MVDPNTQFWYFPPPVSHSAVASDHPPGVDPYANSGSYPLTHAGFQSQPPLGEDPNAASQRWLVKQAEPISYKPVSASLRFKSVSYQSMSLWLNLVKFSFSVLSVYPLNTHIIFSCLIETLDFPHMFSLPVFASVYAQMEYTWHLKKPFLCGLQSINPLNESLLVPTTANSLWNSNWTNQPLTYNSSAENKKLEMKINPTAAAFPGTSNGIDNVSLPIETSSVGGQVIYGSTSVVTSEELETKRRRVLDSGAAVGFVNICAMCNVTTNSPEVFKKHLAGKRHAAQVKIEVFTALGLFSIILS